MDCRSLAAFRIAAGLALLWDLVIRWGSLEAMYGDTGMFPREEIASLANTWNWSFHYLCGDAGCTGWLFLLSGLFALMVVAGFQTRLAIGASWLLLLSLHHRVPMILNGGDVLLRMLLFWAMFLPCGERWSADRVISGKRPPGDAVAGGPAAAAVLLQMAIMYLFSAILKTNSDWISGHALEGTLHHDLYATATGAAIRDNSGMLRIATWATLIIEYIAPFILFVPSRCWLVRMVTIATLWAFHIVIGMLMEVGLFSVVSMTGLLLFIPGSFWNRLERLTGHAGKTGTTADSQSTPQLCRISPAADITAAICLGLVILINISGLGGNAGGPGFLQHRALLTGLGFSQRWGMFEKIPDQDGWFIAAATLADNQMVDLLNGGKPVTWTRPAVPSELFPDHRWRKCFREFSYQPAESLPLRDSYIARYLCHDWNENHPPERKVLHFELIFCMELQPPDNLPARPDSATWPLPVRQISFISMQPDDRKAVAE